LNAEVKAKWVAALLSGEYKQGKGWLRSRQDDYCCLGVLCDLARADGVGDWSLTADKTGVSIYRYVAEGQMDGAELPNAVQAWAGLAEPDPTVPMSLAYEIAGFSPDPEYSKPQETTLAVINDSKASFAQIAKLIEETL
jgi:hypothetical protein